LAIVWVPHFVKIGHVLVLWGVDKVSRPFLAVWSVATVSCKGRFSVKKDWGPAGDHDQEKAIEMNGYLRTTYICIYL